MLIGKTLLQENWYANGDYLLNLTYYIVVKGSRVFWAIRLYLLSSCMVSLLRDSEKNYEENVGFENK